MSGEDFYDHVIFIWCPLCEAPHEPCEPEETDLRYVCLTCNKPIEYNDEPEDIFVDTRCRKCRNQ